VNPITSKLYGNTGGGSAAADHDELWNKIKNNE
jgi:hypothetical protein